MVKEVETMMKVSLHEGDFFIFCDALVLITSKEKITRMIKNNYLHQRLPPMNIFQDGKYYSGLLVGNSPKFIPLDNSLNRYIFHSLCFHCVLGCFVLDGEGTDKE